MLYINFYLFKEIPMASKGLFKGTVAVTMGDGERMLAFSHYN